MKPITEEQRQALIEHAKSILGLMRSYATNEGYSAKSIQVIEIALASLTADTSKLAELAAKVRNVREDASEFDGDRRGMWEHQEEQEQLLLEEAVKYTAPPVPVIKFPDLLDIPDGYDLQSCMAGAAWYQQEIKRLNGLGE